jgi:hypothetical protein
MHNSNGNNTTINPTIGIIDIGMRQGVIDKILDVINNEELSLVEQYGILEHIKFCLYTEALNDCNQEDEE